jgi:hypothetical protein
MKYALRAQTVPERLLKGRLLENVEDGTSMGEAELVTAKSLTEWRHTRALFVLDKELQDVLLSTKSPDVDELPALPVSGMWVQFAEPISDMEGMWLYRQPPRVGDEPGVVFCGAGYVDLGLAHTGFAVQWGCVTQGQQAAIKQSDPICQDLINLFRSLLYAMRWKQILQQTEVVPPALGPKSPRCERREHEREEAKGKSYARYTLLSLSMNDRTKASSRVPTAADRANVSAHIVLGHWHHYWVRDPGDGCVVKVNEKGLSLVAKLLLPYVRGTGEVTPPTVLVKA